MFIRLFWQGSPVATRIVAESIEVSCLPIEQQEITFDGILGMDPAALFRVDKVRRHVKVTVPESNLPSMQYAVWTEPEPPFIDATVWIHGIPKTE